MGRARKRFNWKARQQIKTIESADQPKNEVQLDFEIDQSKYDSCNALVLPEKHEKPKAKNVQSNQNKVKILSTKKKKKLEKLLEKKRRKIDRNQLLDDLMKCQVAPNELNLLTSTSQIQTRGRKRIFQEAIINETDANDGDVKQDFKAKIGKKFKTRNKSEKLKKDVPRDLNVIGLEVNDSSEEENESDLEDSEKTEKSNNTELGLEKPAQVSGCCVEDLNKNKIENKGEKKPTSNKQLNETKIAVNESTKSVYVFVNRTEEMEKMRSSLPIINEEQAIMEAIRNHPVVILCGETGSGKTTQVPQFLYEAGYSNDGKIIGITEPRRISAIAMSSRVAKEMSLENDQVSYQIRFEGNVTDKTKIKFMTDGVLLKEIQNDFLLTKYSAVIIDEAHERSIYSDILIGLLSRIVPLRIKKGNPLKCIIMSATLRIEDFTSNAKLFKIPPPILRVESRQFPVTAHFNKKTPEDYIEEAFKKVCKIHTQSPPGGILVFVTGQQEINILCKKLRCKFSNFTAQKRKKIKDNKQIERKTEDKKMQSKTMNDLLPKVNLNDYVIDPAEEEELIENDKTLDKDDLSDYDILNDDDDDDEDDEDLKMKKFENNREPLYCLPLYSMLPKDKQDLVFKDPPQGSRLCVIATNVAETSLTIPNIKYVVDSGKVKMRVYDNVTGISTFFICWTSKASADQRAGRAGRTGPGHCYRLYSSAVYNDEFKQYSEPEIIRKPVDDLLLQMKAMNIENVVNFPFPSQPSIEALFAAEKRLIQMGALKDISKSLRLKESLKAQWRAQITNLGKAMACFPVCPRYSKMLVLSKQQDLLPLIIAIIAALTIGEIFTEHFDENDLSKSDLNESQSKYMKEKRQNYMMKKRQWIKTEQSLLLGDIMVMLNAVGASEYAGCIPKFCEKNHLRHKAMVEIHKLRLQLTNEVKSILRDTINIEVSPDMKPPNEIQAKLIRQVVLCGFFDHIARKVPESEISDEDKKRLKHAYKSIEVEDFVFISPNSILKDEQPQYVVYQEIFESSRLYMRVVTAIEPEWLPIYVPYLCTFSNPLDEPPPRYDQESDNIKCFRTSTFGPYAWPIPPVEVEYPQGIQRFKLFAKFLLEGDIIASLKKYSKMLLSPPAIILKTWASIQPRTEKLLKALINENIDSKQKLIEKWKTDKNYLIGEYLGWVPDLYHPKIKPNWPPLK